MKLVLLRELIYFLYSVIYLMVYVYLPPIIRTLFHKNENIIQLA